MVAKDLDFGGSGSNSRPTSPRQSCCNLATVRRPVPSLVLRCCEASRALVSWKYYALAQGRKFQPLQLHKRLPTKLYGIGSKYLKTNSLANFAKLAVPRCCWRLLPGTGVDMCSKWCSKWCAHYRLVSAMSARSSVLVYRRISFLQGV